MSRMNRVNEAQSQSIAPQADDSNFDSQEQRVRTALNAHTAQHGLLGVGSRVLRYPTVPPLHRHRLRPLWAGRPHGADTGCGGDAVGGSVTPSGRRTSGLSGSGALRCMYIDCTPG